MAGQRFWEYIREKRQRSAQAQIAPEVEEEGRMLISSLPSDLDDQEERNDEQIKASQTKNVGVRFA